MSGKATIPRTLLALALPGVLAGHAAAQTAPSNVTIYQAVTSLQASVNSLQTSVNTLQSTVNALSGAEGKLERYSKTVTVGMVGGSGACGAAVTLPTGKRLVVQHLSGQAVLEAGVQLVHVGLRSASDADGVGSLGVIVPSGGNFPSLNGRAFASAGAQVQFLVDTNWIPCAATSLPSTDTVILSVYGYLVNK